MKKSGALFLAILFTLVLSSCAKNDFTEFPLQTGAEKSLKFVSPELQGDGCGGNNGYYRIIPRADASNNLYFVEYGSKIQTTLCSRPECSHNDENCSAWLPFSNGGIYPITVGNTLLLLYGGNTDQDMIQQLGKDSIARIETAVRIEYRKRFKDIFSYLWYLQSDARKLILYV